MGGMSGGAIAPQGGSVPQDLSTQYQAQVAQPAQQSQQPVAGKNPSLAGGPQAANPSVPQDVLNRYTNANQSGQATVGGWREDDNASLRAQQAYEQMQQRQQQQPFPPQQQQRMQPYPQQYQQPFQQYQQPYRPQYQPQYQPQYYPQQQYMPPPSMYQQLQGMQQRAYQQQMPQQNYMQPAMFNQLAMPQSFMQAAPNPALTNVLAGMSRVPMPQYNYRPTTLPANVTSPYLAGGAMAQRQTQDQANTNAMLQQRAAEAAAKAKAEAEKKAAEEAARQSEAARIQNEIDTRPFDLGGNKRGGAVTDKSVRRALMIARDVKPNARYARGGATHTVIDASAIKHPAAAIPGVHVREGKREGGASIDDYQDPPTQHIEDWQWRPLKDVQSELQLTEIPSHVQEFGKFMDETARKASGPGLTPRDLIKAYTITRSSIQRQAVDADKVRRAGLILPDNVTGKIRPEGAFGEWLHSEMGQRYLHAAERGDVDAEAVRHAVQVMAPFGKHETDIPDALIWAARNLPGREKMVSDLVARGRDMASSPDEWRAMTKDVRGIGPSKSGFVASLMGRGDQPTLDARQVILHTGKPTKEASKMIARKGGKGGVDAVNRLASRQEAMALSSPDLLKPYYQHLAHHAVWDKSSNEVTTHEDVMNAMRHAATGGAITNHKLVHAMRAAGFPGLR